MMVWRSVSYRGPLVVLLLAAVTTAGWYWYGVTQATYQAKELQLVPFRGGDASGQLTLDAGTHTLWLEGAYVSLRKSSAMEYREVMSPAVTRCDAPDESDIPLQRTQSQVFNTGGREGRSLWTFRAPEAGTYCIAVEGRYDPDVSVMWPRALAVSEGVGLRFPIRPWVGVIAVTGVAAAGVLAFLTTRNRRRLEKGIERPWAAASPWGRRARG